MADSVISALPAVGALTQADLLPIVQAGVTSRATMGQLASLAAQFGSTALTAVAGGTANVLTASFNPQVAALINGAQFFVRAASANTGTIPTIALGTTPAKAIVKGANVPLQVGDISGAGHWLELTYDLALDKFVLSNPVYPAVDYGAMQVASLNGGQLAGFRNKIINGDMRVNQRGATSSVISGAYLVDRWTAIGLLGTNANFGYADDNQVSLAGVRHLFLTCTTAKGALAAADYVAFNYAIEGNDISDLKWGTPAAKPLTLSFRTLVTLAGTYCVAFRGAAFSRTYVVPVVMAAGVNFCTITVPGDTAGAWDTSTGTGINITWAMACGTTFGAGTPNVWQAGAFIATPAQTNALSAVSQAFCLADVQAEMGLKATPFEKRLWATELALCQRYYETGVLHTLGSSTASNQYFSETVRYKASKRALPTLALSQSFQSLAGLPTLTGTVFADGFAYYVLSTGAGVVENSGSFTANAEF